MEYDFKKIEKKWQAYWAANHTFQVTEDESKPKYYVLDMFPYPSGAGLHVGHPLGYIASDIYSRYKRLCGFNVLHPMGYDAFGLPAEQYAIQTGQHPAVTTAKNIARYREQLDRIGFSFDWSREVRTCDPAYYKWTQWAFLKMFGSYYDNSTRFDVTYTLADGTRLTRSYTVYVNEVDLDRAGTVTQLAHQLVNDSKLMLLSYEFHELEANGYRPTGGTFYLTSDTGNTSTGHDLSTSEAQSLYQAIVQDIQEGNLPRTLFYGYGDVHIDLYWSISPNSFNQLADPYNTDYIPGNYISVEITNQAVHTLEVLEELGN